jgi:hypothetical protein
MQQVKAPVFAFPTTFFSESAPLKERGWVLQEELLSPRNLTFSKSRVYWDCLTMQVNTHEPWLLDGVPDKFEFEGEINWRQTFHAGINGLLESLDDESGPETTNFYKSWLYIIFHYSRRKLTRGSDRIAALAGIATKFQAVTKDTYLCGMWKRNLWRQLLWAVATPGSPRFNFDSAQDSEPSEPRRFDGFSGKSETSPGCFPSLYCI